MNKFIIIALFLGFTILQPAVLAAEPQCEVAVHFEKLLLDNKDDQKAILDSLQNQGYTVISATNGGTDTSHPYPPEQKVIIFGFNNNGLLDNDATMSLGEKCEPHDTTNGWGVWCHQIDYHNMDHISLILGTKYSMRKLIRGLPECNHEQD